MKSIGRRDDLAHRIDAILPQTQCRRCGYEGCRPYAAAIVDGEAINRCPPGGDEVIAALAALTSRPLAELDPSCGVHGPLLVARVDESRCIGCVLCRDACPVDAIVGAQKRMHTVLPALCSGCALCLPPCPVDCIEMIPAGRVWSAADADAARGRFERRNQRLAIEPGPEAAAREATGASAAPAIATAPPAAGIDADGQRRRDDMRAARERARARRQGSTALAGDNVDAKP